MASIAQKERAERLFRWKQDGEKALSEHGSKEQATRLLTAKLRAERLAREAHLVAKTKTTLCWRLGGRLRCVGQSLSTQRE